MYRAARLITATLVAAAGFYAGVALAIYAEHDDAPGGVVIGTLLAFGALGLGAWIALRQPRDASSSSA